MFKLFGISVFALILTGCGGGGSSLQTDSGLSETQKNFELFALQKSYGTLDWNLPPVGTPLTSGIHYMLYSTNGVNASPSTVPQMNQDSFINLSTTLSTPASSKLYIDRVLINDKIYYRNAEAQEIWSYNGNNVTITSLASDNTTNMVSTTYDTWEAPQPLTGKIQDSTFLRNYYWFLKRINDNNFDFSKSWLDGSLYSKRSGYRTDDTLFVWDSNGTTYDAAPTPIDTPFQNLSDYFNSLPTGYTLDGVSYKYTDGEVVTKGSTDVWISKIPRPSSAAATTTYPIIFSLQGKLYQGAYQRAGTRIKYPDQIDTTILLDNSIRFNIKAIESIKSSMKF